MDLSKIPEPSEGDLNYAKLLMEIVDYEKLNHHDKAHARIIAHILRHGRVLADYVRRDDDSHTYIGDNTLLDKGPLAEAVKFFEQFGGNDER